MIIKHSFENIKNIRHLGRDDTLDRVIQNIVVDLCQIGVVAFGSGSPVYTIANIHVNIKKICYLESLRELDIEPRIPKARKENYSARIFRCISTFVEALMVKRMQPDKMKKYNLMTGGGAKLATAEVLVKAIGDCLGLMTVLIRDKQISEEDIISEMEEIIDGI